MAFTIIAVALKKENKENRRRITVNEQAAVEKIKRERERERQRDRESKRKMYKLQ